MFDRYYVTGGTGFLGRAVLQKLAGAGAAVRALVLPGDPLLPLLPPEVQAVPGDLTDDASLDGFFEGAGPESCVIHCAGIISIATRPAPILRRVNVDGTARVLAHCAAHRVKKLVYVSSVHALPEKPKGETITEDCRLSPELVEGGYAKTKAEAANLVFEAARQGLDASVASSGRATCKAAALPPWQRTTCGGGCRWPCAAGMTLWTCGMSPTASWPALRAGRRGRGISFPGTIPPSGGCWKR